MDKKEFSKIRKNLKKTQQQVSLLLGVSKKAVESYEQGLRNIPTNIERIMYYLLFKLNMEKLDSDKICWEVTRCPENIRNNCVAWVAGEGFFCWFLTGKTCLGGKLADQKNFKSCFECSFFKDRLKKILTKN